MAQCRKCNYKMEFIMETRQWYCSYCRTSIDERYVSAPAPPPYPEIRPGKHAETADQIKLDASARWFFFVIVLYVGICFAMGAYFFFHDMILALGAFIVLAVLIPLMMAFEWLDFEVIGVVIVCVIVLIIGIVGYPI